MTSVTRLVGIYLGAVGLVLAQGQDGTPGERNLQIIAELLPGIYDNANQAYFDRRLNRPEVEQHARMHVTIERTEAAGLGEDVFLYQRFAGGDALASERWLLVLDTDADPLLVRMRMYDADGPTDRETCALWWRRDAGQFTGTPTDEVCRYHMQLDPDALWVSAGDAVPAQLNRARVFDCYVDIPGVAGGRDEPFDRYQLDSLHDQGGLQWFTTKDGAREIGITLRNVRWPMNNEVGAFTRNSLVMYVLERTEDGIKTLTYGWTEPRAERIGLNLQWLLVNCFIVSNRDVRPFFD